MSKGEKSKLCPLRIHCAAVRGDRDMPSFSIPFVGVCHVYAEYRGRSFYEDCGVSISFDMEDGNPLPFLRKNNKSSLTWSVAHAHGITLSLRLFSYLHVVLPVVRCVTTATLRCKNDVDLFRLGSPGNYFA